MTKIISLILALIMAGSLSLNIFAPAKTPVAEELQSTNLVDILEDIVHKDTSACKKGHSYEAETILNASNITDGLVRYYCEKCGDSYLEIVKAPHSISEVDNLFDLFVLCLPDANYSFNIKDGTLINLGGESVLINRADFHFAIRSGKFAVVVDLDVDMYPAGDQPENGDKFVGKLYWAGNNIFVRSSMGESELIPETHIVITDYIEELLYVVVGSYVDSGIVLDGLTISQEAVEKAAEIYGLINDNRSVIAMVALTAIKALKAPEYDFSKSITVTENGNETSYKLVPGKIESLVSMFKYETLADLLQKAYGDEKTKVGDVIIDFFNELPSKTLGELADMVVELAEGIDASHKLSADDILSFVNKAFVLVTGTDFDITEELSLNKENMKICEFFGYDINDETADYSEWLDNFWAGYVNIVKLALDISFSQAFDFALAYVGMDYFTFNDLISYAKEADAAIKKLDVTLADNKITNIDVKVNDYSATLVNTDDMFKVSVVEALKQEKPEDPASQELFGFSNEEGNIIANIDAFGVKVDFIHNNEEISLVASMYDETILDINLDRETEDLKVAAGYFGYQVSVNKVDDCYTIIVCDTLTEDPKEIVNVSFDPEIKSFSATLDYMGYNVVSFKDDAVCSLTVNNGEKPFASITYEFDDANILNVALYQYVELAKAYKEQYVLKLDFNNGELLFECYEEYKIDVVGSDPITVYEPTTVVDLKKESQHLLYRALPYAVKNEEGEINYDSLTDIEFLHSADKKLLTIHIPEMNIMVDLEFSEGVEKVYFLIPMIGTYVNYENVEGETFDFYLNSELLFPLELGFNLTEASLKIDTEYDLIASAKYDLEVADKPIFIEDFKLTIKAPYTTTTKPDVLNTNAIYELVKIDYNSDDGFNAASIKRLYEERIFTDYDVNKTNDEIRYINPAYSNFVPYDWISIKTIDSKNVLTVTGLSQYIEDKEGNILYYDVYGHGTSDYVRYLRPKSEQVTLSYVLFDKYMLSYEDSKLNLTICDMFVSSDVYSFDDIYDEMINSSSYAGLRYENDYLRLARSVSPMPSATVQVDIKEDEIYISGKLFDSFLISDDINVTPTAEKFSFEQIKQYQYQESGSFDVVLDSTMFSESKDSVVEFVNTLFDGNKKEIVDVLKLVIDEVKAQIKNVIKLFVSVDLSVDDLFINEEYDLEYRFYLREENIGLKLLNLLSFEKVISSEISEQLNVHYSSDDKVLNVVSYDAYDKLTKRYYVAESNSFTGGGIDLCAELGFEKSDFVTLNNILLDPDHPEAGHYTPEIHANDIIRVKTPESVINIENGEVDVKFYSAEYNYGVGYGEDDAQYEVDYISLQYEIFGNINSEVHAKFYDYIEADNTYLLDSEVIVDWDKTISIYDHETETGREAYYVLSYSFDSQDKLKDVKFGMANKSGDGYNIGWDYVNGIVSLDILYGDEYDVAKDSGLYFELNYKDLTFNVDALREGVVNNVMKVDLDVFEYGVDVSVSTIAVPFLDMSVNNDYFFGAEEAFDKYHVYVGYNKAEEKFEILVDIKTASEVFDFESDSVFNGFLSETVYANIVVTPKSTSIVVNTPFMDEINATLTYDINAEKQTYKFGIAVGSSTINLDLSLNKFSLYLTTNDFFMVPNISVNMNKYNDIFYINVSLDMYGDSMNYGVRVQVDGTSLDNMKIAVDALGYSFYFDSNCKDGKYAVEATLLDNGMPLAAIIVKGADNHFVLCADSVFGFGADIRATSYVGVDEPIPSYETIFVEYVY